MSNFKDLRSATNGELIEALQGGQLSHEQLQTALAGALERIAVLEKNWDELLEVYRMFNEQMDAARAHGAGLLKEQ